jgi:type II secretion system protein E
MNIPVYLGELLLRKGLITPEELHYALAKQNETGEFLGEIMVREEFLTEKELKQALAEQLGLPFVEPAGMDLAPEVIESIPPQLAQKYRVVPVAKNRDSITVACANPMDLPLLDQLKRETGATFKLAVTTGEQIDRVLEKYYHERLHNVSAILEDLSEKDLAHLAIESGVEITDLDAMRTLANEAPIIRLVNFFLAEGVRLGASDIHFEPFENEVKLRYRIDGVLYERTPPPRNLYPALISRIKLMAGMDITEKRLPQDGRIRLRLTAQDLDLRVAVAPTLHGEEVVIRILNRQSILLDLDDLGMEAILERFEGLINLSHGMILVTGPTGSGKTTTLYAVLSRLNRPERKIITIEDPVEYELPGVNQIPVNPKVNFGFPQALRTIVRHDPDVILVGEIRDLETAEMAVQSALTGHLVFSTLHTNDAATAFTRLVDMKVEEYLVASTVRGVLAQRLVRRICPSCRVEYQPTLKEEKILARLASPPSALYHGAGCERCNQIGYRGQIGLFELLMTSPAIETLVMKRANSSQIRACAVEEGMETLREDGWKKVRAGLTTIAEVLRVTQS